uniref:Uncharacterized protein n=1 Tax=Phenylobacterium glaciei TaxID=2803784 RepID=A0A974S9C2_9CAUL|nr:hypothetical protein JKL49_02680 [Phenylobacterium glaciei]
MMRAFCPGRSPVGHPAAAQTDLHTAPTSPACPVPMSGGSFPRRHEPAALRLPILATSRACCWWIWATRTSTGASPAIPTDWAEDLRAHVIAQREDAAPARPRLSEIESVAEPDSSQGQSAKVSLGDIPLSRGPPKVRRRILFPTNWPWPGVGRRRTTRPPLSRAEAQIAWCSAAATISRSRSPTWWSPPSPRWSRRSGEGGGETDEKQPIAPAPEKQELLRYINMLV